MIDTLYDINAANKWWQITALSQKRSLSWFIQNSWFVMNKQEWATESLNRFVQIPPWIRSVFSVLLMALFHCMVRHGTVHFWGGFHWVLYLVPDTFLVPLRSRFHASRYRYQNVTCKLCWSLIGRRKSSLLRHWTCDTRPSSTVRPARFKSAQPAKDRMQLLFKQTHIFASTTK